EGRPDLLPGHDIVVAVTGGAGAKRREVGPGAGLAEALAPHLVAAEDPREVPLALLVVRLGDQCRSRVQQAYEVHADVRRAGRLRLLQEYELFGGRGPAPSELFRPVDPRVPGVEQCPLPRGVVLAACRPVLRDRLRRQRWD